MRRTRKKLATGASVRIGANQHESRVGIRVVRRAIDLHTASHPTCPRALPQLCESLHATLARAELDSNEVLWIHGVIELVAANDWMSGQSHVVTCRAVIA